MSKNLSKVAEIAFGPAISLLGIYIKELRWDRCKDLAIYKSKKLQTAQISNYRDWVQ